MGIKEDILYLKGEEDTYFANNGRYVQALKTPAAIPTIGDATNFTELNKPADEAVTLTFTPTAKDYQFWIDVVGKKTDQGHEFGYYVTARRKLADNVIEEIKFRKELENE